MAKGAQTPRQKMINLMYLVFIAMLAMQIDQEIIRSYNDTNESLTETRGLVEFKNDKIFERTLQAKAQNSPDTYATALQQYNDLKTKTNDLVSFIEGIKVDLKKKAEYDDKVSVDDNFASLNNTEPASSTFFKDSDEGSLSKTATDLTSKVDGLRKFINDTFGNNPQLKDVVRRANATLLTAFPNGEKRNNKDWLQYKFYGQPLIAALSNLEVIQSSARNVQSDALVMMLQEKVDADIKFNAYEAIVSGPQVIIQGQPAQAKVVIGTYASTIPGLSITGVDKVENGMGFKTLNTGAVGDQTFSGSISFKDATGKVVNLPYTHTYTVIAGAQELKAQNGAILTADKMNVLYRGLSNPISGSILGADLANTNLSASGASVSGGRGKWSVTPGAGTTVNLTLSGKAPNGKVISQTFPFRIKNVPPPVGQIRGESVVSMPASSIPNQTVSVAMPDFDFPVSFSVNSFMFKVPGRAGMVVNGSSLNGVSALIKNLRSGDIAYIYNINASASGLGNQTLKKIPPVVINVQ